MGNTKRKCRCCGRYERVELGKVVNGAFFCTRACMIDYAVANRHKGRKIREKVERKQVKARKEKLKTISQLKNEAEEAVRRFVRARDKGKPCCSCGRPWKKGANAGHFIAVGSCDYLRFRTDNIHSQCVHCNMYNSGAYDGYREYMVNRYGESFVTELERIKKENPIHKPAREYLVRLKRIFNKRARWYEKRR